MGNDAGHPGLRRCLEGLPTNWGGSWTEVTKVHRAVAEELLRKGKDDSRVGAGRLPGGGVFELSLAVWEAAGSERGRGRPGTSVCWSLVHRSFVKAQCWCWGHRLVWGTSANRHGDNSHEGGTWVC